jgi:hypothetical protein
MTDLRQAAQQALEALKSAAIFVDSFRGQKATQEAITALRKALDQPEQEPVGEVLNERGEIDYISYVPPVGTRLYTTPPAAQPTTEDSSAVAAPVQSGLDADCIASVVSQRYTTPPAAQPEQVDCPRCGHVCSQREWVGLTDDQIDEIAVIARRGNLHDLRIAIEAKLKERNNG